MRGWSLRLAIYYSAWHIFREIDALARPLQFRPMSSGCVVIFP
jgi:hypothetical protein